MRQTNRSVSLIITICFLLNAFLSDLAFSQAAYSNTNSDKLAVGLLTDDIVGKDREIAGRVMMTVELGIREFVRSGLPLTLPNLKKFFLDRSAKVKSGVQPFWQEIYAVTRGFCVRCRAESERPETYHTIFTLQPEDKGGSHVIGLIKDKNPAEITDFRDVAQLKTGVEARAGEFESAAKRIWTDAIERTADWLKAPQHEVVRRLSALDKEVHSQLRLILSERVANYLGSCSLGISRIFLFGSANGAPEETGPVSDIDLLIEISTPDVKAAVERRVSVISRYFTANFNRVMAGTGISMHDLIDISDKVLTENDTKTGKGFAQFANSTQTSSRLLFDKKVHGFITPEEATKELNALPVMGSDEALRLYNSTAKQGVTKTRFLEGFLRDLKESNSILQRTRPVDELNMLVEKSGVGIKQLDILRAASEIILQLVSEREGIDNIERLAQIRQVFARQPVISKLLIKYFETRFNPKKDLDERGEEAGIIRVELLKRLEGLNGNPDDRNVLQKTLGIMIATVKTDYYIEERTELFLRIDPRAIVIYDEQGGLVHTPPYAIIWVHVPYGVFGAHSRYTDVARGGLRSIRPERINLRNKVLPECIALSITQNRKHVDIAEGGSKGAFVYNEGLNSIASAMGYVNGLISCAIIDERIAAASGSIVIDPLELGPDEGTGEMGNIITALAYMRKLGTWRIFMTGKSGLLGGVSHMENDLLSPPERGNRVTSQGVMAHAFEFARYLREKGMIRSSSGEPLTLSVTGWLDGDVGSGIVERAINHHGDDVSIRSGVDISGVVLDPSTEGLDHETLLKMYASKEQAMMFPKDKLHVGGFVAAAKAGSSEDSYTILGPDSLKFMNTRALDPEVLKQLGLEEKYKSQAGLKGNEDLIVVLERDDNGHPAKIKVHNIYLRDAFFFLAKSDMLITGGGVRNSIDNKNWELFFDWDGKPVSAGIVHGANVFIEKNASINLEQKGVAIEPDEKANSVGVEISSKMEVDFNLLFKDDEITPALMGSYFEQVLAKCLENAGWKFWALRIEAEDRLDKSVVAQVSPAMSAEIIKLHEIIMNSSLVGDRKEAYREEIIKRLEYYFPDVGSLDRAYGKSSLLGRVFDRMPVARLKMTAAKLIAKELVLNLGMGAVSSLSKDFDVMEADVIKAYLEQAERLKVYANVKAAIENKENLLPSAQIESLREARKYLKEAVSNRLAAKKPGAVLEGVRAMPDERRSKNFAAQAAAAADDLDSKTFANLEALLVAMSVERNGQEFEDMYSPDELEIVDDQIKAINLETARRRAKASAEIKDVADNHAVNADKYIPTSDGTRYKVLVDDGMCTGEELRADRIGFDTQSGLHIGAANRFDLERVNTSSVDNILRAVVDQERTIVQVSRPLTTEELLELSKRAPKLRVIRVNTTDVDVKYGIRNKEERQLVRFDLYNMMLWARRVTADDIRERNSIYRAAELLIKMRLGEDKEGQVEEYLNELVKDIAGTAAVVKYNLLYRPSERWIVPEKYLVTLVALSA